MQKNDQYWSKYLLSVLKEVLNEPDQFCLNSYIQHAEFCQ